MTNDTFSGAACAGFANFVLGGSTLTSFSLSSGSDVRRFALPDCFWTSFGLYSSSLDQFTIIGIILSGNSSGSSSAVGEGSSNPLLRLSTSITSFVAENSVFVDPTNAAFAPNWQTIIDYNNFATLECYSCAPGGPVFTQLPSQLLYARFENSGLTGTISASMLSLVNSENTANSIEVTLLNNQLSGTFPAAFFANFGNYSQFSSISISFSGNKLSGSVPPTLFSSGGMSFGATLQISLSNNSLTGSLPGANSFTSCPNNFLLDVSWNQLSGTIVSSTFDSWLAKNPNSFQLRASHNAFTGAAPSLYLNMPPGALKRADLAAVPAYIQHLILDLSHNKISSISNGVVGNASVLVANTQILDLSYNEISSSVPAQFLSSTSNRLVVDLTANKIPGALPSTLLTEVAPTYRGNFELSFHIGYNKITSIPDNIFAGFEQALLLFNVTNTPTLTGTLPPSLATIGTGETYRYNLDFSKCGFTGSIPRMTLNASLETVRLNFTGNRLNNGASGFRMSNLVDNTNRDQLYTLTVDISDNAFVGVLNVTGLSSFLQDSMSSGFNLNASGNSFTALAYDDSWASVTRLLDISRNTLMTSANFPESLFNDSSNLRYLYASKTGITGVFPSVTNNDFGDLREIDFSGSSGIDFCSGNRTAWTTDGLDLCKLYLTTAANCTNLYPSLCEFSAPPEAPTATPSATPASGPIRPPTGAASATSASFVAIALAALIALVVSA